MKFNTDALKKFWSNVQTHMNEYLDEKKIAHNPVQAEGLDKLGKIGGQAAGGFAGWTTTGLVAGILSLPVIPTLIVDYIGIRAGLKIVKNAQEIRNSAPAEARPGVIDALGTSASAFGSGFVGALKDVFSKANSNDNNGQSNNNAAPKNTTTQQPGNKR